MDIDINRVVFDHHWLFSKEDTICSVIRNLHSTQTLRAEESLVLLKSLINEKQHAQRADPSDTEQQTRIKANVADLVDDLEEKQSNYIRLGQLIDENWHRLRFLRHEQGFSSTTLTVQKTISTAQEMADLNLSNLSEHLQEFTRIPVYTLLETNPLTEERPKEEMQRLALINKCHIQMLIHFNDILVCKTKFRAIDANFSAVFGQIYNLQIHEIPQSVTVTFIEKAPRIDSRILAKVGLPLPDEDKITSADAPLESIQFASDLVIDRMFSAVGSGAQSPCIAGKLFCNVSWAQRGIRTSKAANIRGLFKLNQQHQQQHDAHFDLIPKAVRLCTDEEFESDLRLEVLKQRSERKLAKNRNTERVPLMSSEIDPQIMSKNQEKLDDQFDFTSGIEAHRITGSQYAAKIRRQLLDRFANEERIQSMSEIVREEPIPTIFSAFGALFAPMDTSRKLKPMRRVDAGQQFIPGIRYRIAVNIQSAVNLSERLNGGLHPLVEASFQRMRELEKDFKSIVDSLELNIYDQIVSKLYSDDREPNSLHEQLEKHLIGSARIPFSALLCNSKIDGYLRIQKPLFLSSYKFVCRFIYNLITAENLIS
ncbi:unnamed protein product [Anisakis simplex]|uniref:CC2D2A N-terminal C2 domain-containing protein n=1 Tax=Anisakis simplex TaxID=6269 RepID=A0A3P6RC22_ANISI|nr:unnamed protein product [Anisakis simplex]